MLVHIIKIEYCDVTDLAGLVRPAKASVIIPQNVNFTEINMQELTGVKMEDTLENGERRYNIEATFQTCDKTPDDKREVAFRLTSADGNRFLLGTDARPYAIMKENNPYPQQAPDSSLKTVSISYQGPNPLLLIL